MSHPSTPHAPLSRWEAARSWLIVIALTAAVIMLVTRAASIDHAGIDRNVADDHVATRTETAGDTTEHDPATVSSSLIDDQFRTDWDASGITVAPLADRCFAD